MSGDRLGILTRLGVGVADPSYLEIRLSLLEQLPMRSIKALEESSYRWIIVTDTEAEEMVRERLEKTVLQDTNAVLYAVENVVTKGHWLDIIEREMGSDGTRFLARLDDDDCFTQGFFDWTLDTLRYHTNRGEIAFTNAAHGYALELHAGYYLESDYSKGIGILMCTNSPAKSEWTPYTIQHHKIQESDEIVVSQYEDEISVIRSIHGIADSAVQDRIEMLQSRGTHVSALADVLPDFNLRLDQVEALVKETHDWPRQKFIDDPSMKMLNYVARLHNDRRRLNLDLSRTRRNSPDDTAAIDKIIAELAETERKLSAYKNSVFT